ncbi:type II toxin-antitoxin system VapB family antitoxin [Rhodopseudomonas palustris]|nr:type II toxin-antitoxin system VapB family antitoxin [Rhodopseudomonas palustris]
MLGEFVGIVAEVAMGRKREQHTDDADALNGPATSPASAGRAPSEIAAKLLEIGARYAARPDTGLSPDDILGYDRNGLPT